MAPATAAERAARLLYLNRTCWNGLYRVNLRGEFNVPIGTKNWAVSAKENFEALARTLSAAELRCCDFEASIDEAGCGDYLFLDPPYTVKHNMNGFLKYNEKIFCWADQIRLRDAVLRARNRGAAIVMTNADHDSIHELYDGRLERRTLHRSSVLAGLATKRGRTTESMFVANI
jgi:DNA adenine methylase